MEDDRRIRTSEHVINSQQHSQHKHDCHEHKSTNSEANHKCVCVRVCADLLGEGGELEDVECLIKAGRVPVDVYHHGDPAGTTEEELQEVGEFGLSEGDVVLKPAETRIISHAGVFSNIRALTEADRVVLLGVLVELHGADALPERQQRAVDVSGFLQSVSGVVSPRAALRPGQVAQSQPKHTNDHLQPTLKVSEAETC